MESFAEHMPAFVPLLRSIAVSQSDTVRHKSLADLLSAFQTTSDGEKAMQSQMAGHSWNRIWNKVQKCKTSDGNGPAL